MTLLLTYSHFTHISMCHMVTKFDNCASIFTFVLAQLIVSVRNLLNALIGNYRNPRKNTFFASVNYH